MSSIYQRVQALISGINRRTFSKRCIMNRAKVIASHTFKKYRGKHLFSTLVHIEITNICNLNCIMCPTGVMRREKGYMDINLYQKIIYELSTSAVETIALSLYGESLLHRDFPEFLRIAKSAGLSVFLSTNGLMLSEEVGQAMIDSRLDFLIVSYDSSNPLIYEDIRRGGRLDPLNYNLERFLRLKGRRLPLTVLQCIEFPGKESQAKDIRKYWKEFNVRIATRPAHDWLGDVPEINKVVFPVDKKIRDYGICDQPWRHAVIFWDGRVSPCCNFYDAQVTLGNLNDKSLAQIWNSKEAEEFRKMHISFPRKQIQECSTCRQKSPGPAERIGLGLFDMATINMYLSTTDGRRE